VVARITLAANAVAATATIRRMTVLPIEAWVDRHATLSSAIGDIPLCGRKLRMSKCV